MREVVIVGAARTPIAKAGGALRELAPEVYAGLVIKEAVQRSGLKDAEMIDEVIFGCCFSGAGCMARVALLKSGLPISIPALTIDRQCTSGNTAVNLAAALIQAGCGDIYVVGGVESLSQMPWLMQRPAAAYQTWPPDSLVTGRRYMSIPEIGDPEMSMTGENVAERWGVTREEQDEFGYLSQVKAGRALQEGRFKEQIVPVVVPQRKGEPIVFDTDEHPRPTTTREQLAKLPPAFKKDGTITAGSSSGLNDAAAAMVVASREKAEQLGMKPLARVIGFAAAGVDPNIMGIGPVPATNKVMAKTGLTVADMDVVELNEAFAAQAIPCCEELGIDWRERDRDKVNPNGGAIALGHPIAASLAILTIKAMYELQRRQGRYALITACGGGGQGVSTIIERC